MRSLYTILALLLLSTVQGYGQSIYYFSNEGDDSRSLSAAANNPNQAFRSLAKAQEIIPSLQEGDQILFRRGDVFQGSIEFNHANPNLRLTLGAYGDESLARPIITGFKRVTAWTQSSGRPNVWEATVNDAPGVVNRLTVNGNYVPKARFPNAYEGNDGGYLEMAPGSSYSNINYHLNNPGISNNLLSQDDVFIGAECVVRTESWLQEKGYITSQAGGTIHLSSSLSYPGTQGFGFFIQNHPQCLDQEMEWVYDVPKLMMYSTQDPNSQNISVATVDNLLKIVSKNNITIENITFTGSNRDGLFIDKTPRTDNDANGIIIRNCEVLQTGETGIFVNNTNDLILEYNTIYHVGGSGIINKSGGVRSTIAHNTLRDIGMVPGDGPEVALLIGITAQLPYSIVEHNTLDSIGYSGIQIGGTHTICRKNLVQNFCQVLTDGAGIYGFAPRYPNIADRKPDNIGENKVITQNVVLNARPPVYGSLKTLPHQINGIYMDYQSENVEVSHNTVAHIQGNGIHLHASRNIDFINNVVYDCDRFQMDLFEGNQSNSKTIPFDKANVIGNKLVAKSYTQDLLRGNWDTYNIVGLGTIDSNIYCNLFNPGKILSIQYYPSPEQFVNTRFSLSEWFSTFSYDEHGKTSPISYAPCQLESVDPEQYLRVNDFEGSLNPWFINETDGILYNGNLRWQKRNLNTSQEISNFGNGKSVTVGTQQSNANNTPSMRFQSILDYRDGRKIDAGSNYRLSFDIKASEPVDYTRSVEVLPFKMSKISTVVEVDASPRHYEWVFKSDVSSTQISPDGITFLQSDFDQDIHYDNISLQKVDVTWRNPDDYFWFEYALEESRTLSLDNEYYYDLEGNFHFPNSSIELAPYTSEILIRVDQELASPADLEKLPLTFELIKDSGEGQIQKQTLYSGNKINYIQLEENQSLNIEALVDQLNVAGIESLVFDMDYFNDGQYDEPYINLSRDAAPFLLAQQGQSFIPPNTVLNDAPHRLRVSAYKQDGAKTEANKIFSVEILFYVIPPNIYLEAECGQFALDQHWTILEDSSASYGKALVYSQGDQGYTQTMDEPNFASPEKVVTYDFVVPQSGDYHVWARVKAPSSADDSFWIKLNEGDWTPWEDGFNQPDYSDEYKWVKLQAQGLGSPLALSKGPNTLGFTYRENGTILDNLFLSLSNEAPSESFNKEVSNPCYPDLPLPEAPPQPNTNPVSAQFYLEAECSTVGSNWSLISDPNAENGHALVYDQGEQGYKLQEGDPGFGSPENIIRFQFEVPSTGSYHIWARHKTPNQQDDSFWVRLNGGNWTPWWGGFGIPSHTPNFKWARLKAVALKSPLNLPQGTNTMEFMYRENGTFLDKIFISDTELDPSNHPDIATINTCLPATPGVPADFFLEAECAQVGSEWTEVNEPEASQGRALVFEQNAQGYFQSQKEGADFAGPERNIAFQFEVPLDGTYRIWARVKAPSAKDDSFWVRLNSGDWHQWWKGFATNQYTNNYKWIELQADNLPYPLNFTRGTQRLEFSYRENGTYLDKIFITSQELTPQDLGGEALVLCPIEANQQVSQSQLNADMQVEEGIQLLSIYPNPIEPKPSTLQLSETLQGRVEYFLNSQNGEQLAHGAYLLAEPTREIQIDFSNLTLKTGIYHLFLSNGGKRTEPIRVSVK